MAPARVFLIVEDSKQDFQDVSAYVQAASSSKGWEQNRDYIIENTKNRKATEGSLNNHEQSKNKVIAIFDLHMEESNEVLTELIATLISAPEDTWRGRMPIIVFSQSAEGVDKRILEHQVSKRLLTEKQNAGLFSAISKSPRSREDGRTRLRKVIQSVLWAFDGE